MRGCGEYNSQNSCEQQLDTQCFVCDENLSAVVNVKTGGMFLRISQNGESVQLFLALVALWSADKGLSSAVALVRVGRALLSSFPFPDTLWCLVL